MYSRRRTLQKEVMIKVLLFERFSTDFKEEHSFSFIYSTVTLLARLRGLSTSRPLAQLM